MSSSTSQQRRYHLLPESELSGSLPQSVNLFLVVLQQKLVVNDKEGVSGDIVGEGWEVGEAWHSGILSELLIAEQCR